MGIRATPAVAVDGQVDHSGGVPSHQQVELWLRPPTLELQKHPTRHMFFTGKGGVGKTTLSTAVAIYLVDCGKRVLLVSTGSALTTVVLVTRPEKGAITEASRISGELKALGLGNQWPPVHPRHGPGWRRAWARCSGATPCA